MTLATPASSSAADVRVRVAFIDDDSDLLAANVQSLELAGFEVLPFSGARAALGALAGDGVDVVVSDIRMPDIDGLQLFRHVQALDADIPVILITGHGDIAMAVQAMRDGVYDFLAKPYAPDRLRTAVAHAGEKRRLVREIRRLRDAGETGDVTEAGDFIGNTPAMLRIKQTLRHIADADVDVLIHGETGSGKEVVANALHRMSRRRAQPFVALNCGALPDSVIESELFGHEVGAFTGAQKKRVGRIEYASGGTLFLDEIESMPLTVQVKMLRVLETRQVAPLGTNQVRDLDLRVVAATKEDLGDPGIRGRFREDLYYRLNVVTLHLPPLRERRDDIALLFAHQITQAARRFQCEVPVVTDAVRRHLATHDWPGNVRELAHFAERFVLNVMAPPVPVVSPAVAAATLPERVEQYEGALIREALREARGDVRATLERLGIPRKTFYDKLQRHGIERGSYQ